MVSPRFRARSAACTTEVCAPPPFQTHEQGGEKTMAIAGTGT